MRDTCLVNDGAGAAGRRPNAALPVGGGAPRGFVRGAAGVVLAGALVLGVSSGCGYRSDKLFRNDIESVYVEMFESKEFRRDLEFMLTEALKKRIGLETPYRIASREKADTIMRGEVLEERQASFAPDFRTRRPRDQQLTLAVRVQWKDQRNGRMLMEQSELLQAVDYLPPLGETEKFAQEKAIDKLAARIVGKMYDEW